MLSSLYFLSDCLCVIRYRDMLLNVVSRSTGHICEVQISLQPLLAVKMGGGHVCYEVIFDYHLHSTNTCTELASI